MRRGAALAAAIVLAGLAIAAAAAAALPKVAIDPGHGGEDTGATGVLPDGTATGLVARTDERGRTVIHEKDVNLDVATRLDAWLRARDFPTVMTRTRDLAGGDLPYRGALRDLKARVRVANDAAADLFVSVHENALRPTSSGTETYHFYFSSPAARALAVSVHQEVVLRLGLPDRGIRSAGFYVLKHTAMPAVLVEGAFLSNPAEALLLADARVRQSIAEGVGAGIARYVQAYPTPPTAYGPPATPAPLTIRYRVTAGAFRRLADARRRVAALRRVEIESVIRRRVSPRLRRTLFYVVTGQFVFLSGAREQREELRALDFPAKVGAATAPRPRPSAPPATTPPGQAIPGLAPVPTPVPVGTAEPRG